MTMMSLFNHFAIFDLLQCPCLLKQAIVDRGRYQPDFECDQDGNTACELHQNAKHCVTTGLPKYAMLFLWKPSSNTFAHDINPIDLQSRRCRPAVLLRHCRLLDDVVRQPVGWQASPLSQLGRLALERSKQDTHHVSLLGRHPTLLSMLHVAGRTEQRLSKLPVRKKELTGLRWIPASRRG